MTSYNSELEWLLITTRIVQNAMEGRGIKECVCAWPHVYLCVFVNNTYLHGGDDN